MNQKKWILMVVVLIMIGTTSALVARLKSGQALGKPGVKTTPLPGSKNLEVQLPATVLDYSSEPLPLAPIVLERLPKDTSFGQRLYRAPDGAPIQLSVVLMGTDRTSIHKPEFCLTAAGWRINSDGRGEEIIPVGGSPGYELPVIRLHLTNEKNANERGVFLYWFVADNALSADPTGLRRLSSSIRELALHGQLQRWAYVLCFAQCKAGDEAATLERMKKFLSAATPEFQLPPRTQNNAVASDAR